MKIKCGISTTNHTPYTEGKWREGSVMDSVLTYEQKLEREIIIRKICKANDKKRMDDRKKHYKQLRDKWVL
jgi:hypothetical protein